MFIINLCRAVSHTLYIAYQTYSDYSFMYVCTCIIQSHTYMTVLFA